MWVCVRICARASVRMPEITMRSLIPCHPRNSRRIESSPHWNMFSSEFSLFWKFNNNTNQLNKLHDHLKSPNSHFTVPLYLFHYFSTGFLHADEKRTIITTVKNYWLCSPNSRISHFVFSILINFRNSNRLAESWSYTIQIHQTTTKSRSEFPSPIVKFFNWFLHISTT